MHKKNAKAINELWGGRFSTPNSDIMEKINSSIDCDYRLAEYDIQGSVAHVKMLHSRGIIPTPLFSKILEGLEEIRQEIFQGKFEFQSKLEDIHMNIENRLFELIGEDAGFMHIARSRNDQVATDFRLWVRENSGLVEDLITEVMKHFLRLAEIHHDSIMPGFTHMQAAQPVTFGHHMLAYVEMLSRDLSRFSEGRRRLNECPLGAAALGGTGFPIDRFQTAKELGFDRPMANSLDAVSDRDFALDFLSSSAICCTHLSRFAEELVLWSNQNFSFIGISDRFSTGSSIMPQKRNPDSAELIRAKSGILNGTLLALLTILKGLPLAYSKDLQEDKELVFKANDNLQLVLRVLVGILSDLTVDKVNLRKAAEVRFITATDMADHLVKEYMFSFRKAHKIVGQLVKKAEELNCDLKDLSLKNFQEVEPKIQEDISKVLSVEDSVFSKLSYGGTSPSKVKEQVKSWQERLS